MYIFWASIFYHHHCQCLCLSKKNGDCKKPFLRPLALEGLFDNDLLEFAFFSPQSSPLLIMCEYKWKDDLTKVLSGPERGVIVWHKIKSLLVSYLLVSISQFLKRFCRHLKFESSDSTKPKLLLPLLYLTCKRRNYVCFLTKLSIRKHSNEFDTLK